MERLKILVVDSDKEHNFKISKEAFENNLALDFHFETDIDLGLSYLSVQEKLAAPFPDVILLGMHEGNRFIKRYLFKFYPFHPSTRVIMMRTPQGKKNNPTESSRSEVHWMKPLNLSTIAENLIGVGMKKNKSSFKKKLDGPFPGNDFMLN